MTQVTSGLFCSPSSHPNPKHLLYNHKKCKIKPSVCCCFQHTLYLMWPYEAKPPSHRRSPSPRPPKPLTGFVTHSTAMGSAATLQRMRPTPGGGSTWGERTPSPLSKSPTEVTAAPRDWMERRLESGTHRRTTGTTTPGAEQNLSQTFLHVAAAKTLKTLLKVSSCLYARPSNRVQGLILRFQSTA